MVSRVERNRSRLPDPTRFKQNLDVVTLGNYVDDLVKTLRLRLESIESEMDYQDDRSRVVEATTDIDLDTSTPIVLCTGTIEVNLPNAIDAFDDQAIFHIKSKSGAVTVSSQPGEDIENAASYIVNSGSGIIVVSDGDDWWITASYP